jgi:hypothetical protein
MTLGVNVDPNNASSWAAPDPAQLHAEHFQGVRLTSRDDPVVYDYAEACKAAGLQVLAIITGESGGYVLPQADIVQIGNEPDLLDTWLDPAEYASLWDLYRGTYPQFVMFSAGLASGDPRYMAQVLDRITSDWPAAIAIHPYAKTAESAAHLFDAYWNLTSLVPVVATEWWQPSGEGLIWPFQDMLNNQLDGRSTIWSSWFCYTDAMVPGFGLRDHNGVPTDTYYELVTALA